jgi:hypothetical protein
MLFGSYLHSVALCHAVANGTPKANSSMVKMFQKTIGRAWEMQEICLPAKVFGVDRNGESGVYTLDQHLIF